MPLFGTSNEVHARFELRAFAHETLQTAARLRFLFKHGYFIAVSCEDVSARKAAKSATNDDTFFHLLLVVGHLVMPGFLGLLILKKALRHLLRHVLIFKSLHIRHALADGFVAPCLPFQPCIDGLCHALMVVWGHI